MYWLLIVWPTRVRRKASLNFYGFVDFIFVNAKSKGYAHQQLVLYRLSPTQVSRGSSHEATSYNGMVIVRW